MYLIGRRKRRPRTPKPALNTREGVNYPYRCQKEPIINTVHKVKAGRRKSNYVKGAVNKEKLDLLFDTGAEVSLVSFSTGLMITDS